MFSEIGYRSDCCAEIVRCSELVLLDVAVEEEELMIGSPRREEHAARGARGCAPSG